MSYAANVSDIESDKNEYTPPTRTTRPLYGKSTGLISKIAARKLSTEPKWNDNNDDIDSELSSGENFLTKGAFLLTPSYELSMERAALICEKMSFKGCFSLTKTATGILFKFSNPEDYQAVLKKGFHKVTGARFYRKIAIPCRPRKTFTLYILDVPDDLPVADIRHAMYKFNSVVEVVRLHIYQQHQQTTAEKSAEASSGTKTDTPAEKAAERAAERAERREIPTAVIRVTLASMDEYNILLQNGLNFYDATFFPTEANVNFREAKIDYKRRMLDGSIPGRVRELLPVFDATGFCKIPPPTYKLIKPPRS